MDMDPRDARKYCMYKYRTFNNRDKHDYSYSAIFINK